MTTERDERHWIGFDLGGTKMLTAAFDDRLKLLARARKKTRAHLGAEANVDRMIKLVDDVLKDSKLSRDQIAGMGVGVPGPLDLQAGIVREAPNLGWRDLPLVDRLKKEFGFPVVIANDVDLGVYGEYRAGAGKGERCVIGLFPGTGVGGGCVYEGRIFRGKTMSCLEIGHVPIIPDGPLCSCGLRGCLEAVASRLSVSALALGAAHRGKAPYLRKKSEMSLNNIRSSTLAAAVENGDKAVEDILRTAAEFIGRGVAILVHLMAPDVVVLGGGLVEAMPKMLRDRVHETAQKLTMKSMRDTFRTEVAELGDDSAIIGAAAWAQHEVQAGAPPAAASEKEQPTADGPAKEGEEPDAKGPAKGATS